jgi:glutaminase
MHSPDPAGRFSRPSASAPLHRFLSQCHAQISSDKSGAVADYIPELRKADPDHFGVSLATIDGHIYEIGDSNVPFTIQ